MLIAQAVLFAAWAFLMFRTLFKLTRRARAQTGAALPGPVATLKIWRNWFLSKEDQTERRKLGIATLAVMIGSIANYLFS